MRVSDLNLLDYFLVETYRLVDMIHGFVIRYKEETRTYIGSVEAGRFGEIEFGGATDPGLEISATP